MIDMSQTDAYLSEHDIKQIIKNAFDPINIEGKKVLVLIPDTTRTAPVPLFFRQLFEHLWGRVKALDYLVALGTHPILGEEAINRLVGITAQERNTIFSGINIFNHRWDIPETFISLGKIPRGEIASISSGMLSQELNITINRLIFDYDLIIVCGPVFPHEVMGFSGSDKYFFPGISGPEVINFTHWLGALMTSKEIIGKPHTPMRALIEKASSFIKIPRFYFNLVTTHDGVAGIYPGMSKEAWFEAVKLSSRLHIQYIDRSMQRVLSIMPEMYSDLWTAAKGMYKLEPVIADGGEVVIYAPHINEISYTHGQLLDEIGYHVRDYFVKQWDRFKDMPWCVLAHSAHLRGVGEFDLERDVEEPRIKVTLASGIPRERCEKVNLGYCDPAKIDVRSWEGREEEGILVAYRAGEVLYRLKQEQL
jgi:nickel-dependent lactate racemase